MSNDKNNVEQFIIDSLKDIEYGSVEITIHDSKVVQIEKSIKRRFDK